jgi:hypothetical protein
MKLDTFTDQQVRDIVNTQLDSARVAPGDRIRYLREHRTSTPTLRALAPVIDRYLEIVDPPRTCQVEHAHWEGPMICGNPLPCRTHGGG